MSLRVSLARDDRRGLGGHSAAPPMLDPAGARVILGSVLGSDALAAPVVPAADALFGPRGAMFLPGGGLAVADTGHHRLLLWNTMPERDGQPADLVLGQPDFGREGRNAKENVSGASLNVPTGLASGSGVLAVADAWNHRVLIWHGRPTRHGQSADVVLGQSDFGGALANRGGDAARADTLNWCYGVAIIGGRLLVADTGNRRVLIWNEIPTSNGVPADLVLGQTDFDVRDENGGRDVDGTGMRWPHGIAHFAGKLLVSDAGNNRIMGWHGWPDSNGNPADFIIGQGDPGGNDHNHGQYYPDERAFNMPYGLAVGAGRLLVADTANSRLTGFGPGAMHANGAAGTLAGQRLFVEKGDNRWGFAARDSLCWPYGIAAEGHAVAIADSGNNRVLLWDQVP